MKKTSLYLNDAEVERLRRLARLEHTSQAEIVRRAIARYVPDGPADRNFALFNSGEGDGRSVADISDDELFEGFGS
ncbi:MAG: ribbon-helix-helix domain-containing protein [Actinomycetota bacterium]|nr:ribbon-helix-helix domain-containing protein [Actinomycetota bacterium]